MQQSTFVARLIESDADSPVKGFRSSDGQPHSKMIIAAEQLSIKTIDGRILYPLVSDGVHGDQVTWLLPIRYSTIGL